MAGALGAIRTQVVVAGAGPVGGVLASLLARAGVAVVLLEAGADCAQDLRASTFHPPTLEMLDRLGMTPALLARGLKAPVYHFRERQTGDVIAFDMGEIADATRYPFRLQCEQFHLARMLADDVEGHGGDVRFGHRLVAFSQDRDAVTAHAETAHAIVPFRCDFLVGADGANSIVRKWLGLEFDGFTWDEKFLCYTTGEPLEQRIADLAHVNYVSDPEEWMVLLRVPSLWRVLVPADADMPDEELRSDAHKDMLFDRLLGDGAAVETVHRTIYRVHQRVAKRFVAGRVAIIGDAAHLNNPLGGFGMNSGIHDAFALGERLVRHFREGAEPEAMLRDFDRLRRRTCHDFIQAQTIRNMEYLRAGKGNGHERRRQDMEATRADPARRRAFLLRQAMIESLAEERARKGVAA